MFRSYCHTQIDDWIYDSLYFEYLFVERENTSTNLVAYYISSFLPLEFDGNHFTRVGTMHSLLTTKVETEFSQLNAFKGAVITLLARFFRVGEYPSPQIEKVDRNPVHGPSFQ